MSSLKDEIIEEAKQDAADIAHDVKDKVSQLTAETKEKVQVAIAPFRAVGGNFEAAVRRSANDQPTATLAMAATFGFVLGALWRS